MAQLSQSLRHSVLQYRGRHYPLDKPQTIMGSDQSRNIRVENNSQVLPIHDRGSGRRFSCHMTHHPIV